MSFQGFALFVRLLKEGHSLELGFCKPFGEGDKIGKIGSL